MLNKLKLVVLGLVAVGVIGFFGFQYLNGAGTIHVVAEEGRTLELAVNGEVVSPKLSQFGHQKYEIPQGSHEIEVRDPVASTAKKYKVEIDSGFSEFLLPKDDQQCFTRLDVTRRMYSAKGGMPEIKEKWTKIEPIDLPGTNYFHEEETPKSIKEKTKVHLVLPIACASATSPDDAILAEMGW